MKTKILGLAIITFCLLGCGYKHITSKKNIIRIGAILPLTGSAADLASQHLKGLQLAINELNSISKSDSFQLILDNDRNDPKTTVTLANKQINSDKVSIIITVMSSPSKSIAPILESNHIPLFANCGNPTITEEYSNVFRNFPSTKLEVQVMAKFISDNLNIKRVSLLFTDDAYGKGAEDIANKEFPRKGVVILNSEAYSNTGTDFRTVVTKLLSLKPQAIYVYGYGQATSIILNNIRDLGYSGIILGTYNFSQPPVTTISKYSIEGSFYTIPSLEQDTMIRKSNFWKIFYAKYNSGPFWNSIVEYDAIMIINKGINLAKEKNISLTEALKTIGNYRGMGGEYIFDQNANEWILPMSIANVKNDGIKYIN